MTPAARWMMSVSLVGSEKTSDVRVVKCRFVMLRRDGLRGETEEGKEEGGLGGKGERRAETGER